MNNKDFNSIVEKAIERIRQVLLKKGEEYATDNDRLHNFKRAGLLLNCTPERALQGMLVKHLISYLDIVDDIDKGTIPSEEKIDEKIGDIINYFILFEALVSESRKESIKSGLTT